MRCPNPLYCHTHQSSWRQAGEDAHWMEQNLPAPSSFSSTQSLFCLQPKSDTHIWSARATLGLALRLPLLFASLDPVKTRLCWTSAFVPSSLFPRACGLACMRIACAYWLLLTAFALLPTTPVCCLSKCCSGGWARCLFTSTLPSHAALEQALLCPLGDPGINNSPFRPSMEVKR